MTSGLTGCGGVKTIPPPANKLVCADDPAVPELAADEAVKAKQKADYLTALWAAGADCRSQLEWNRDYWANQPR